MGSQDHPQSLHVLAELLLRVEGVQFYMQNRGSDAGVRDEVGHGLNISVAKADVGHKAFVYAFFEFWPYLLNAGGQGFWGDLAEVENWGRPVDHKQIKSFKSEFFQSPPHQPAHLPHLARLHTPLQLRRNEHLLSLDPMIPDHLQRLPHRMVILVIPGRVYMSVPYFADSMGHRVYKASLILDEQGA